ncbi:MAG: hypothetical protein N3G19_03205 [Candidatus Pacearchaeota archaeon]|nr:hypothetical protein [Candidatus Pacearchaeota archaeon]
MKILKFLLTANLTIGLIQAENNKTDAGNFSIRFGYGVGKEYAKNSALISPKDARHIFNQLAAWMGYYIENRDLEKAREIKEELEKTFENYEQNEKIKVAKIELYNVLTEAYLDLYKILKDTSLLDSAESYNKKVFEESKISYKEIISEIEKEKFNEKKNYELNEAYNNLGLIIREKY